MFLEYLACEGIDISNTFIERAGNLKKLETAQAKKQIISQYLETGLYNQVYLYDDSLKNIQSFVTLRSTYPKVKLVPIHVKIHC